MPATTSPARGTNRLVFIPTDASGAARLVSEGGTDVQGFTVTPQLRSILDLGKDADEEAERAAMVIGSIWGLAQLGRRLVLVAELPASELGDNDEVDNGGVTVGHLQPSRITAWFADEDDSVSVPVAGQVSGMVIDDAWNDVAVQSLLAEHEMSWHDITEALPTPDTDPVRS